MESVSVNNDVADQAVEGLRNILQQRLVAVVLFGSRARGDAIPGSDWDLLVIARDLPEKPFDRLLALKFGLPLPCRGAVSILARTPEEFERTLPSLYLDIALDARILYDPAGYASQRIGWIRQLIGESGLARQRTPAGDVWQWTDGHRAAWPLEWAPMADGGR